jgi:hypothetical protein
MERFKDCRLARMSSGHYRLIRDLGTVKGGKGLRHHEWTAIHLITPHGDLVAFLGIVTNKVGWDLIDVALA